MCDFAIFTPGHVFWRRKFFQLGQRFGTAQSHCLMRTESLNDFSLHNKENRRILLETFRSSTARNDENSEHIRRRALHVSNLNAATPSLIWKNTCAELSNCSSRVNFNCTNRCLHMRHFKAGYVRVGSKNEENSERERKRCETSMHRDYYTLFIAVIKTGITECNNFRVLYISYKRDRSA